LLTLRDKPSATLQIKRFLHNSALTDGNATDIKVINDADTPLKSHTSEHPAAVFGTLNAYQWLIYIPLHNIRHNQQIVELKSSPSFPKP